MKEDTLTSAGPATDAARGAQQTDTNISDAEQKLHGERLRYDQSFVRHASQLTRLAVSVGDAAGGRGRVAALPLPAQRHRRARQDAGGLVMVSEPLLRLLYHATSATAPRSASPSGDVRLRQKVDEVAQPMATDDFATRHGPADVRIDFPWALDGQVDLHLSARSTCVWGEVRRDRRRVSFADMGAEPQQRTFARQTHAQFSRDRGAVPLRMLHLMGKLAACATELESKVRRFDVGHSLIVLSAQGPAASCL